MALIRLSALDWICFALLVLGAINWGILGIIEINLVATVMDAVFQPASAEIVLRTIYVFIGLAGIYFFYPLFRIFQTKQHQTTTAKGKQPP